MLIRLIDENDLQACGQIYAEAFSVPPYRYVWEPKEASEMLNGLLQRDPQNCWCAVEDGQVVGFAFCTTYGRYRATIQEFAISPYFRKKGLGTRLMEHVLHTLRQKGFFMVDLIAKQDAPAYSFYRKFGFRNPNKYTVMALRL